MLIDIYELIDSFHEKNITIGNLSVFSFRQTSAFVPKVQMIELNLLNIQEEAMGHAFKSEKSMDWEAFGFIVESVMSSFPPVFIPHKLQYVDNSNPITYQLLRGSKVRKEEF